MTSRLFLCLTLLGLPLWAAAAAPDTVLLDALGAQLHALRGSPPGPPSDDARCPSAAEQASLAGLSRAQVHAALGQPDALEPDFFEAKDGQKASEIPVMTAMGWTYFFTHPVQPPQMKGGFPQLSFVFGPDNRVRYVSCRGAR